MGEARGADLFDQLADGRGCARARRRPGLGPTPVLLVAVGALTAVVLESVLRTAW